MKPTPAPHTCPACAYPGLQEAPRTKSGGGSYEICPCCGYQFGVDDDDRDVSYATHRQGWVSRGMKWFSRSTPPPPGWNPATQVTAGSGLRT